LGPPKARSRKRTNMCMRRPSPGRRPASRRPARIPISSNFMALCIPTFVPASPLLKRPPLRSRLRSSAAANGGGGCRLCGEGQQHQGRLEVTSRIFDLMGARATSARYGFDRVWRNVRSHTLHDPVAYKAREVGTFALNGRITPDPSGRPPIREQGCRRRSKPHGRDRDTARATLGQGLAVSAFPRYVPV
jgi:hypothetical protein